MRTKRQLEGKKEQQKKLSTHAHNLVARLEFLALFYNYHTEFHKANQSSLKICIAL